MFENDNSFVNCCNDYFAFRVYFIVALIGNKKNQYCFCTPCLSLKIDTRQITNLVLDMCIFGYDIPLNRSVLFQTSVHVVAEREKKHAKI